MSDTEADEAELRAYELRTLIYETVAKFACACVGA